METSSSAALPDSSMNSGPRHRLYAGGFTFLLKLPKHKSHTSETCAAQESVYSYTRHVWECVASNYLTTTHLQPQNITAHAEQVVQTDSIAGHCLTSECL